MQVYRWRRHLDDADPYWLTAGRAADVLRIHVTRVNQLVAAASTSGSQRHCLNRQVSSS